MRSASEYMKTIFVTLLVAVMIKVFVVEAFRIPSGSMENTLQVGDFLLVNKLAYGIRTPRHIPFTNVAIPVVHFPFSNVRYGDIVVFEFPGRGGRYGGDQDINYIKRCIGLPGDTIEIRGGRVFVNNREMLFSNNVLLHRVSSSGAGGREGEFGPVVVPKEGDRIGLDPRTIREWREMIEREGHEVDVIHNGEVLIDGKAADSYVIERDYFFMLGDNRLNSLDSRFWGFVPRENLIGEALMVYWSWDPDVSLLNVGEKVESIRWGRVGSFVR
jgi:signal peptidase I